VQGETEAFALGSVAQGGVVDGDSSFVGHNRDGICLVRRGGRGME
jgi:hypothetical protein